MYYDFPNLSPEQRATYQTLSIIENSAQHQANLKAAENAALDKAKRDAENEKLLAKFRAEREAELKAEAEARRKESAANFEADLRRKFFEGNSFADESDFRAMLPELKKRAMLQNTDTADKTEKLLRESGNYGAM